MKEGVGFRIGVFSPEGLRQAEEILGEVIGFIGLMPTEKANVRIAVFEDEECANLAMFILEMIGVEQVGNGG